MDYFASGINNAINKKADGVFFKNQINIDCISEPQCFSFCLIGTIPVKPEDLLTDRQAQCGGEKGFTTDSYW